MSSDERAVWLTAAWAEVSEIPSAAFLDACRQARRGIDHPAKLIPYIVRESEEYGRLLRNRLASEIAGTLDNLSLVEKRLGRYEEALRLATREDEAIDRKGALQPLQRRVARHAVHHQVPVLRRDGIAHVGRDRGGVVEALQSITVPVVVVSIDTDRLFPVRLQAEIAELAPAAAPLVTISSPFGHDGFLVEVESVGEVIRKALNLAK